ncbi:MAG: LysR family transcriptional regulator [Spirochaetales bacterium]|nr:LysR family transcriptional regulator [Spirochaetales bacterium]
MDVKIKIYFTDNDKQFMGIGVYWLLLGIQNYGSIRRAAEDMHLSYVKALGMLNTLEKTLNKKILNRKRGGDSREGATLTSEGKKLVSMYQDYQQKIKSFAEIEFEKFRIDFGSLD